MSGRRCYPHRARFERELRCAQEHDIPISGATFTAIRFRFNCNKDIRQIIISSETDHSLPSPSTSPLILPKFILSQLEAQRVADPNRIPPQLSVVLELISETFSKKPTRGKAFTFPTLFRYYHGEWTKTYFVFAYLDLQMESRKYTIDELQQLKTTYCRDALDKLCANHEVGKRIRFSLFSACFFSLPLFFSFRLFVFLSPSLFIPILLNYPKLSPSTIFLS